MDNRPEAIDFFPIDGNNFVSLAQPRHCGRTVCCDVVNDCPLYWANQDLPQSLPFIPVSGTFMRYCICGVLLAIAQVLYRDIRPLTRYHAPCHAVTGWGG